jgi:hypothetical protein
MDKNNEYYLHNQQSLIFYLGEKASMKFSLELLMGGLPLVNPWFQSLGE